jgi:lipid A 3-O-deacylase
MTPVESLPGLLRRIPRGRQRAGDGRQRKAERHIMQLKLYRMILVFVFINLATQPLSGNEIAWRSIGLRGGVNDNRGDEDFKQCEGFTTWSLPWTWHPSLNWTIGTYLEANAGLMRGGGQSAFVGSIGPGIDFTGFNEKIQISLGINPTIISKHRFGDENLGGPVEFTSHIGVGLNFTPHFTVGYRLQHMSNGVLYEHNPGLNMHMIEVGYRF